MDHSIRRVDSASPQLLVRAELMLGTLTVGLIVWAIAWIWIWIWAS
jgi:hypothetical protein